MSAKTALVSLGLFCLITAGCQTTTKNATTLPDVGHIHAVSIDGGDVLVGAHYGLFRFSDESGWNQMGDEFDVMGLTVTGEAILVSGHPGEGFAFPDPLGLLASTDGGQSWSARSLTGGVDFHFLTSAGDTLIGFDATNGRMLHSSNRGQSWDEMSLPPLSGLAMNPSNPNELVIVSEGVGLVSFDSGDTFSEIRLPDGVESLVWSHQGLYVAAGMGLFHLADIGSQPVEIIAFDGLINALAADGDTIAVSLHNDDVVASFDGGQSFSLVSG